MWFRLTRSIIKRTPESEGRPIYAFSITCWPSTAITASGVIPLSSKGENAASTQMIKKLFDFFFNRGIVESRLSPAPSTIIGLSTFWYREAKGTDCESRLKFLKIFFE